ncbi:hypothetical protein BDZ97DRAFT_1763531 [Flammula alnicola]|nr:hypothetical protein BDZ97DRAFT_1763531 [Flammula alnicola]
MAAKKHCPCPTCDGQLRDPKTVRKHGENMAALEAERARWYQNYQIALKGVLDEDGNDLSDDEMGSIHSGESGTMSERPNKRSRVDSNSSVHNVSEAEIDNQRHLSDDGSDAGMPLANSGEGRHTPAQNDNRHTDSEESDKSDESTSSDSSSDDEEENIRAHNEAMNLVNNPAPDPINLDILEEEDPVLNPSNIEHVRNAQDFIDEIRNATLDNGKLDPAATERLRHPDEQIPDLSDENLRFSLDLYMSSFENRFCGGFLI